MNFYDIYFKPIFSKNEIKFNKSLSLSPHLINDIDECLKKCFKDMVFSKIPYFLNKSVIFSINL